MNRQISIALLLVLLCGWGAVATASAQTEKATTSAAAAAPTSGYRAEFLKELSVIEQHMMGLAEAIPAEKYTWRPGEGVRSISEVFMHVAGANYNLPRLVGTPPPTGFTARGFDTSTAEKAKVVETLKQSFAHVRQAALNMSDADSDKAVKLFGDNTYRGVLFFMIRHMGEHMGQAIAYARMNKVVPPWTEEQQQRQRQQQQQQQQQAPPKPPSQ